MKLKKRILLGAFFILAMSCSDKKKKDSAGNLNGYENKEKIKFRSNASATHLDTFKERKVIVSKNVKATLDEELLAKVNKPRKRKVSLPRKLINPPKSKNYFWNGSEVKNFERVEGYEIFFPRNTKGLKLYRDVIEKLTFTSAIKYQNKSLGFGEEDLIIVKKTSTNNLHPELEKMRNQNDLIYVGSDIIRIKESNRLLLPVNNQIMLLLENGKRIEDILKDFNAKIVYKSKTIEGAYTIEFQKGDYFDICQLLNEKYDCIFAKPNFYRGLEKNFMQQGDSNNTGAGTLFSTGDPWHLKALGFNSIQGIRPDEKDRVSAKISVLDDHVDIEHEALEPNLLDYFNFSDSTDYFDRGIFRTVNYYDHGTLVSGAILAKNKRKKISGICPDCKLFAHTFGAPLTDAINWQAFERCIEYDADILNFTYEVTDTCFGEFTIVTLNNFINNGRNGLGGIAVFALGNDSSDLCSTNFLKEYNVFQVGASDQNGNKYSTSNFGSCMTHMAPGQNIESTLPLDAYGYIHQTSAAAPVVSGSIGMLLEQNSNLTYSEIFEIMKITSESYNNSDTVINLQRLLNPFIKASVPENISLNENFTVGIQATCPHDIGSVELIIEKPDGSEEILKHIISDNDSYKVFGIFFSDLVCAEPGRYLFKPIIRIRGGHSNYPNSSENLDLIENVELLITDNNSSASGL